MKLRTGHTVASTVDATRMIVIRAPEQEVRLTCGGAEMVEAAAAPAEPQGAPAPDQSAGTLLGKRYVRADLGLELLCTKPGTGTVAADGEPLELRSASPLPASD